MCSKPIFCSKIALKGKTCSRLLKPQKVAPNAKSCSKVAEHNRDRPTYKNAFRDYVLNQKKGCKHGLCAPGDICFGGECVCEVGSQAGSWCNCVYTETMFNHKAERPEGP
ncbi:uncharacterized protein LOC144655156 [Oculina patagonica]